MEMMLTCRCRKRERNFKETRKYLKGKREGLKERKRIRLKKRKRTKGKGRKNRERGKSKEKKVGKRGQIQERTGRKGREKGE